MKLEIRFTVGVYVNYEKNGRIRNYSKGFGLSNRKDGSTSSNRSKIAEMLLCLLSSRTSKRSAVFQIIVALNLSRKSPGDGKAAHHLKRGTLILRLKYSSKYSK